MKTQWIVLVVAFSIIQTAYAQDYTKIQQCIFDHQYYNAIKQADSLLLQNPNDANTLYLKAKALQKTQRYKQAELSIQKAHAIDSTNSNYIKELGRIYLSQGKYTEAINPLSQVFYTLDSLDYATGILLTKCYMKTFDWNKALHCYNKLICYDSTNTSFLYYKAICLTKLKQGKDAIPFLEKIAQLDSTEIKAPELLFKIYEALDEREKALEQLNQLKRLEPNNYEHYQDAAYFHLAKNHIYLASDNFEKSMNLGDPEALSRWDYARCLIQMKRFDEAIENFKFLEDQNGRFMDFVFLADCYMQINQTQLAIEYYDKALTIAIPSAFDLNNIFDHKANLYIKLSDFENASKCYEQAIGHFQGISSGTFAQIDAAQKLAELYKNQMNQPQKALSIYQSLLTEISEYKNPQLFNYYKQELEKLNEEIFFKGN